MQFELMHLSLLAREQPDMFSKIAMRRETWLREVFSERIRFNHRGDEFHYVPDPDHSAPNAPADSGLIVGRIVRPLESSENEPPEAGAREIHRQQWQGALLFLDPSEHENGQKLALQHRANIGKPLAVIQSLASHINTIADPRPPYVLLVAAITDASTFWEFVDANEEAGITNVEFDLITPNMFDGPENIDAEMKALRDQEKARRLKLALENDGGLELRTNRIKTIVDYTAKGGGTTKARARNRRKYNSKGKIKKVSLPEPAAKDEPSRLAEIFGTVKAMIFGR